MHRDGTNGCRRGLRALHANDVGVRIGRIVAAPRSPVDQQRLRRVEPQPDERYRGGLGDLFNGASVGRPRIHRIDDDAVARAKDQCGMFCQMCVHALGQVR